MAESKREDRIDASDQTSTGDIASGSEEASAHVVHSASSRPQAPSQPLLKPTMSARPVAPADADLPAVPAPPSSAARITMRAVTPVTRKARPMAPTITNNLTDAEVGGDQSTALTSDDTEIVDDQDIDIMPIPDASIFAQTVIRRSSTNAKAVSRKHLEFRRTMIPILFTCGLVMFGFASLKYVSGSESSLTSLPVWVPILLVIAGAIVLALAVVNILVVKAHLRDRRWATTEPKLPKP